jgi:hypothetical protein
MVTVLVSPTDLQSKHASSAVKSSTTNHAYSIISAAVKNIKDAPNAE